ncbi:MAG: penicillin-binding protein activator [Bdellovibrionaceae bacterium]|nr:penicillin-binding protein activator [Pseudobdellovibrionaceae bacterium]
MRSLLFVVIVFSLVSCQGAPKRRPPTAAPAQLRQELATAQSSWQNRDSKKAIARAKRIIELHPESDIADDAALLIGDIYGEQQNFVDALKYYNLVAMGEIASPLEMQASLKAARSLIRMQRPADADPYLEKVSEAKDLPVEERMEALEVRHEILAQQKMHFASLEPLILLVDQHPVPGKKDRYRQLGFEILESRLSEDDLQRVAEDSRYGFLQMPAKYRYALLMAEQRNYSKSRRYLGEIIAQSPDSDLGERAQMVASQIDARQKVDPRTIGVVLPLSGKQAVIGYRALRGIQHGLGIYGKNPTSFRLAVIDSEGNADVARRAIERLVLEDNVIAIVGGLLSKTATAEATKANEFGVPILTMSQKAGVTQIGEYVFRNAMTSQMQVQQLVEIAMSQGLRRFAMVFPNDSYGVEFSNLFWDEVRARGGSIQGAQPYDPAETDFRGHVQRLVGTFYLDDRSDYEARLKEWKEKNPTRSARQGGPTPEEILQPIVDFDAVFIPDSAKAVGQIAPMLAYNDVTKVQLLGTNIWNNKALLERADKFVEGAIFVDSFLSTDRSFQASDFFNSFKQVFDEEPSIFEVQGYDSALLFRQIIGSGETSRLGVAQRLAQMKDFPGALGHLSASVEREIRRPVVGLTVSSGKIVPFGTAKQQ